MTRSLHLIAVLILMGAGWGLTMPLTKIAVSDGYGHFGLIFWQFVLTGALMAALTRLRGRPLPFGRRHLPLYLLIALIGTLIPNSTGYMAAAQLPAGVMSIVIATVPLFAFPLAIVFGNDSFSARRAAGSLFGMACVGLMIGPEASLPDPAMAVFIPLALIAPFFYGLEGNTIGKWGTRGLDPIQLLAGASLVGTPMAAALAVLSGQWITPPWPLGAPDKALIASAVIHGGVYSTYFWMITRAGPIFTAQVSYLVTGFGIMWSMLLLAERYSPYIWAAFALMMVGLFLVQPRGRSDLPPEDPSPKLADDV